MTTAQRSALVDRIVASATRWITLHNFEAALEKHGPKHPATWAAYGRARSAWKPERIPAPAKFEGEPELAHAYTTAQLRELEPGFCNRHRRRIGRAW